MRGSELIIVLSDGVASLSQFVRSGRTRELVRRVALALPEDMESGEAAARAAALAADADMAAAWTGLVLDGGGALVREFSFPFRASAKVERAVRFEMEGGLPCPARELVGDALVERTAGGCRVFSFSLRGEMLGGVLEPLRESGVDPALVSLDLAALASFAQRMPRDAGPACVLDVGFGRTLLAVVGADGVSGVTRRGCGVGRMVDAVEGYSRQDLLDGTLPEGDIPEALSGGVVNAVERAARQLALTSDVEPSTLLVCGVGAALPGIIEGLEARSGIRAVPVWSGVAPEAFGLDHGVEPVAAGALGNAGLMGGARSGVVNLRQGEFAHAADVRGMFRRFAWAGVMALLLLTGFGASFVARGVEERHEVLAGIRAAEDVFRKAVPDAKGEFGRTQMFSILKTRIDRLRGRRSKDGERATTRTIEILRSVNAVAPAELDVILDALTVGDDGGRIMGTAGDYQAVNSLLERVVGGGVLTDVRIVVASAVKKTGRVRFELEYARK